MSNQNGTIDPQTLNKNAPLLAMAQRLTALNEISTCGGGEWAGPCPFCKGTDRFRVQPNRPDGPRWFCRGCGDGFWHSAIDFVIWRDRLPRDTNGFKQAAEILADVLYPGRKKAGTVDREAWRRRANDFVAAACRNLWSEEGEKAICWLEKRGLTFDTILEWRIGFWPDDTFEPLDQWGLPIPKDGKRHAVKLSRGIVIPCADAEGLHYLKIRRSVPSTDKNKYVHVKGGEAWLFGVETLYEAETAFLFESELDALLAWQTTLKVGCISLPAGGKLQPGWARYFSTVDELVVAYDQDEPGRMASAKLCAKSNRFQPALALPDGAKDLTEYHQNGGDVLDWLLAALDYYVELRGKCESTNSGNATNE